MQILNGKKIPIINEKGQNVSVSVSAKKGLTFFGFRASPKGEGRGGVAVLGLKEPHLKGVAHHASRADLDAVKSWVGLEEKIVHDYKAQKTPLFKRPSLVTQASPKPFLPAFETFSTQTTVSLPPSIPKLKDPVRFHKRSPQGIRRAFSVLAGLAACTLVLLYVQGILSSREASRELAQLQSEKVDLEQSYAALQAVSVKQTLEIQGMDRQLRDMAANLKTAQDQKNGFLRSFEQKYREELMSLTLHYEAQLDSLHRALQAKEARVNALKAKIQEFEKIVAPVRMSAVSGVAADLFRRPLGASGPQGKILSVNGRQGFVVIDLGGEQGARSGGSILFLRDGVVLTTGRIDRVYPSMSAVLVRDAEISAMLQAGDTVSFS